MKKEALQWQPATPGSLMNPNDVHVWRASLDLTIIQQKKLLGTLSAEELSRALRFRFEKDQMRFIAARGFLRQILGHYLEKPPDTLRFEYTSSGKPMLVPIPGKDSLRFNLSHADTLALFAVTHSRDVGIDIERIRDEVAVEPIARRFFSPGELRSMELADESNRNELFFQYWNRKEALVKAMGEGLSFPMEQFDVSCLSEKGLSPILFPGDKGERPRWYLQDLFPGAGYTAAIAVEGGNACLSYWDYSGFLHSNR